MPTTTFSDVHGATDDSCGSSHYHTPASARSSSSNGKHEVPDNGLAHATFESSSVWPNRTETSVPYSSLLPSAPTGNADPRRLAFSVLRASIRWLKAWESGTLVTNISKVDQARAERADVTREQVTYWKSRLRLLEHHLSTPLTSAEVLKARDFLVLGGLEAVHNEQQAWRDKIKGTFAVELYIQWFIVEQKLCGRQPSEWTDIVVLILSTLLRAAPERKEVDSLLCKHRNPGWELC